MIFLNDKYRRFYRIILAAVASLVFITTAGANEKFHGKGHGHGEVSSKEKYDSLFAAAIPVEKAAEGKAIIESCLNAYGGTEHLEKLSSVRMFWRMLPMMTSDSVDIVRTAAAGRKYKVYRKNQGGFESRMILGNKAWFQSSDTTIELNSGRYKAELFSYLVLSMPLAIKSEPFNEIRYGRRHNDPLHYIYMDKPDSIMVIIGIDPDDFMIKRAEGVIRQEEQAFVFENLFSDHQEHDGYIFPHNLTNISMGLTVGQSVLKQVVVNAMRSDDDFMPGGIIGD